MSSFDADKYKDYKRVIFNELPTQHARLLIQLHYDQLRQGEFFRSIIEAYVEGDEDIFNFIQKYKLNKKVSKRNVRITKKEKEISEEAKKQFALDSDDIEDIFDILEQESEGS